MGADASPPAAPPRVLGPDEPRGITRILELQSTDTAIDRLRARREALQAGEDARAARERVTDVETTLGELQLQVDGVARDQKKLEGDIDLLSLKIAGEERRLYDGSVANVKELESIQAEVRGLRERTGRMEDELLELMERRESMEAGVPELERQLAQARGALDELQGDAADELASIGRSLDALAEERSRLLPAFDEELLELYEDLRRQKKRIGATALREGVCGGCRQKLSAVELDRLRKATGIRRCEYCRRIVVFV